MRGPASGHADSYISTSSNVLRYPNLAPTKEVTGVMGAGTRTHRARNAIKVAPDELDAPAQLDLTDSVPRAVLVPCNYLAIYRLSFPHAVVGTKTGNPARKNGGIRSRALAVQPGIQDHRPSVDIRNAIPPDRLPL